MSILALKPISKWDDKGFMIPYVGIEGTSQAFTRGGIGKLSSGVIIEGADAETSKVCCIFKNNATGTAGSKVDAYSLKGNHFLMQMYHSANVALAVTAQTDVGVQYGISLVGHNFYVNKNDTSNKMVEIVSIPVAMTSTLTGVKESPLVWETSTGLKVPVALGDRYGLVVVSFLDSLING